MILRFDEAVPVDGDDNEGAYALWTAITKKYSEILAQELLTECTNYRIEEFRTWEEAVDGFFDSTDEDTIANADMRLLFTLIYGNLLPSSSYFFDVEEEFANYYKLGKKKAAAKRYKESLFLPNNEVLDNNKSLSAMIEAIDKMDGITFETFVGKLFGALGYQVEVTKSSGDQGVDVIAVKGAEKLGIQAKRYSKSVDNTAVQEIIGGKKMYDLTKMMVLTNNTFTTSAKELAKVNDVILWDRDILLKKVEENIGKL